MAGDPNERLHDTVEHYEGLDPSQIGGPPRAGGTTFPVEVDKWPEHDDGMDEKVFAKYLHDAYCAMLVIQTLLKLALESGIHNHRSYPVEYGGNNVVGLPESDEFVPGTVRVALRGRVLAKDEEWEERPDKKSIKLLQVGTPPEDPADIGDAITIDYAVQVVLP